MDNHVFSLVVTGGTAVLPSGIIRADIAAEDGKIAAIGAPGTLLRHKTVCAEGKYVLPAVVDAHVHFNDPGLPEREDMHTGTSAAAAGGVGTVIDMPLSGNPAVTSVETLELKKSAAQQRAVTDYALWGGLVSDNTQQLEAMSRHGAAAFKAFTCFAGNDFPYATPDVLLRGMKEAARIGALVGVHCEDEALTAASEQRARAEGRLSVRDFLDAHSPLTERLASDMVMDMAAETGARVHICHATLPSVIDRAKDFANVTVETCPHYLIFSEDDLERLGGVLKCTPPVRSKEIVEELWKRVFDGSIDMISSDHSPSATVQKNPSSGSFWDAWGGVQGVQTMLCALYTEGVVRRGLPLERLVELVCASPAKIFGLYPQKGALQLGSDADFVIFDPNAEWTLTPEILLHKNKHSPYIGRTFCGRVESTFVRGSCVYENGTITARAGSGQLITPAKRSSL